MNTAQTKAAWCCNAKAAQKTVKIAINLGAAYAHTHGAKVVFSVSPYRTTDKLTQLLGAAMRHPTEQFRDAIEASGLMPPDVIHDDGKLHRFGRGLSGYYVLHSDGVAAGLFGCWREGLKSSWCAKPGSAMTPAERDQHKQRIKAAIEQRDADEATRQQCEADKAATRWGEASHQVNHPYLQRKGVKAYGIRQDADTLLIPLRDTAGKLHSLQTITVDGDKRFKGRVKGCYHSLGKPDGVLIVCEGFATGASIHEATGQAVAVAFNAGNLMAVATALHKKYPKQAIVLAADDDHHTEGNPGLSSAKLAALAVGGYVVAPHFQGDRPAKATDFNDMHQLQGLEAVNACFLEILEFIC